MIYFDHNATTPIDDRVVDAMLPFFKVFYGNPSSLYRHGRLVRSAIDTAREQVAHLVGAQPAQLVFTSGGTEANNLALMSAPPRTKIAISAIEHPSISETAEKMIQLGHQVKIIHVDSNGLIVQAGVDETIAYCPMFVSIMLANNETGVIQDITSISQQMCVNGIIVHTDAVQGLGKIPIDFNDLGVDMMSLSSHKIYGPKGCGALIYNKKVSINPILKGGGQEDGMRAGTENVPAIIGFGKAAELARIELAQRTQHLQKLKQLLEERLTAIPGVSIFAQAVDRLPNTVQFGIQRMDGEMLLMMLDQKGVAVSSGSACASAGGKPSPVLTAMGISIELSKSSIRISLGKDNTESEIIEFITLLEAMVTPG